MATVAVSTNCGPVVLVVNDHSLTLPIYDYNIESVGSAHAALERLQRRPLPGLVLMNLQVPGGDGLRTLQKARELHPKLKVIMFGPSSEARSAAQAVRMGALDYLSEPLEQAEFHRDQLHALSLIATLEPE